eukprot:138153-Chlamydomonas_euryale.AAC.1
MPDEGVEATKVKAGGGRPGESSSGPTKKRSATAMSGQPMSQLPCPASRLPCPHCPATQR